MNASDRPGPDEATPSSADGTLLGGRYRVHGLIGRGGMASVYRAEDETLGRTVAVKLFNAEGTETGDLRRQTSEIRLLASLNHHALVTLFDASVDDANGDARAFLVMELVEGKTLQERLTACLPAQVDVALMVADIAEALHTVHERGVVHRDIKPANVLLSNSLTAGREFRAKLADFGIAYLVDSTRLTTPGTLIGTAAYVSPEQALGKTPGPASDIYSLGLVLLEALTGARAFPGTVVESLTARIVNQPPIPANVGPVWADLIARMTALEPSDRPDALDIAHRARALEAELTGPTPPWFAAQQVAAAGVAAGVAAGAAAVAGAAAADLDTEALGATEALASTEALSPTEALAPTEALSPTEALAPTAAMPGATGALAPTQAMPGATEPMPAPTAIMPTPTTVMGAEASATEVFAAAPGAAAGAGAAGSTPSGNGRRGPSRRALVIIGLIVVAALVLVGVIWGSAGSQNPTPVPTPSVSKTPTPSPTATPTSTPAVVTPSTEPTVEAPAAPAAPSSPGNSGNGKDNGKPDKDTKPGKGNKKP